MVSHAASCVAGQTDEAHVQLPASTFPKLLHSPMAQRGSHSRSVKPCSRCGTLWQVKHVQGFVCTAVPFHRFNFFPLATLPSTFELLGCGFGCCFSCLQAMTSCTPGY